MFHPYCQPYLLLASPQLEDSNFQRTVILIVEHNEEHAMGFIVNRPAGIPLRKIVSLPESKIPEAISSWYGGPVGLDTGVVLHNSEGPARANERLIADRVRVSGRPEYIEQLVVAATARLQWLADHGDDPAMTPPGCLYPFRFLVGYAGWGAQQLDDEIRQGSWMQIGLDRKIIFDTPWDKMWETALRQIGFHPSRWVATEQAYVM